MAELTDGQAKTLVALHYHTETPFVGLQLVNAKRALVKLGYLTSAGELTATGKPLAEAIKQTWQQAAILKSEKTKKRPGSKASQKPTEAPTATKAKAATPVAKKPKAPAQAHPEGTEPILIAGQVVGYVKEDTSGKVTLWEAFTLAHKSSNFSTTLDKARARFLERYTKGEIS
jgi:hypothetical protein